MYKGQPLNILCEEEKEREADQGTEESKRRC